MSQTLSQRLDLWTKDLNRGGLHEIESGVYCEVLSIEQEKTHNHIRGSYPPKYPIEASFRAGAVVMVGAVDAWTDIKNGITFLPDMRVIRESAVTKKLLENYACPDRDILQSAEEIGAEEMILPLGIQRGENYCRWWLDCVSRLFLASRSKLVNEEWGNYRLKALMEASLSEFQKQSIRLVAAGTRSDLVVGRNSLYRGRCLNSPGLTHGGGQNIGTLTIDFCSFLKSVIPEQVNNPKEGPGPLLYITRADGSFRRVLNEPELTAALTELGFEVINPGNHSVEQQACFFRNAKLIVSPHGAALTNLIFCRPGTRVVEIFPEGGVHGSAFLRISSHLDFDYFFVVAKAVENRHSLKKNNPNNADMIVNVEATVDLIREAAKGIL